MTDTFASALAQLQADLPRITKGETARVTGKSKDGTPISYTYAYAGLADVSDIVLKAMGKLGLSWVCCPTLNEQHQFVLKYALNHVSGDGVDGEYPLPASGTPQEIGSAITYARRYCLCAVTGVAPDEDDDGAAATKAQQSRARAKPPASRAPEVDPTVQQRQDMRPEGAITATQMRHMQALFGDMKITERGNKLAYAIDVVKHQLDSSTQLTEAEADQVIDSLKRWKAQDTPPAEPPGKEEAS